MFRGLNKYYITLHSFDDFTPFSNIFQKYWSSISCLDMIVCMYVRFI